jgi:hypothetical protein
MIFRRHGVEVASKLYALVDDLWRYTMSTVLSFLPQSPVSGLAAAGFNLIVALGLIAVSLALGVAISLLIGLPAIVTEPRRAIRARSNLRPPE